MAGGSANPRADVEQSHAQAQVHLCSDRFGGFAAANVEFVHGGKVVCGDAVARLTGRFEDHKNALLEIFRRVVLRDADFSVTIVSRHAGLPSLNAIQVMASPICSCWRNEKSRQSLSCWRGRLRVEPELHDPQGWRVRKRLLESCTDRRRESLPAQ